MTQERPDSTRARRAELLDSAIATIAAEGPTVSMDVVAQRAGTSKPTIYRFFGSKRGLYEAIGERYVDELTTHIAELIAERPPLEEFLERMVMIAFTMIDDNREVYAFLMQRARMDLSSANVEGHTDFLTQLAERAAPLIRQRRIELGRDPDRAHIWAHAVAGMLSAVGSWWLANPHVGRDEVCRSLSELLWAGFAGEDPSG